MRMKNHAENKTGAGLQNASNALGKKPLLKELAPETLLKIDKFAIGFVETLKNKDYDGMDGRVSDLFGILEGVAAQNKDFECNFSKTVHRFFRLPDQGIIGIDITSKGKPFSYVQITYSDWRKSLTISANGGGGLPPARSHAYSTATGISEKMRELSTKLLNLKKGDSPLAVSIA